MEDNNQKRPMNILVTGACGLIGSELCNQLTDLGHCVIAVDNMYRGTTIPKSYIFWKEDISKEVTILPNNIDVIYHLAAINGTTNFYDKPNKVISNNTRVDLNVFEFAAKCPNLKKFIYASSSEMMSHQDFCLEDNKIEIDDISNPRWSYKISKMLGENYLHNSSLPWTIIRYFNVYGPETKSGHIVYDQIINHKNKIYKVIGPEETRCYTYVKDAIEATIVCVENSEVGETINIGSNEELTSLEVSKIIGNCLGYFSVDYELIDGRRGSAKRRVPNLEKLLEYYPDYSPIKFSEGIKEVIKCIK